jgi:hypothetical protein
MFFRAYRGDMEDHIEEQLREAGDELRARHDDAVIADVIGDVEALDDESSDETAEILRLMTGLK